VELNECLLIINLIAVVLGLLGFVYAICKIRAIEYFLDHMKDPEEIIKEIMKTKIPIIFDRDGNPIPITGQGMPKQEHNPLVG